MESLRPSDFNALRLKLSSKLGVVALRNEVQRVRTAFKFLYDCDEIARPVKFGPSFVKPSAKSRRKAKNERPEKSFKAEEIRDRLDVASPHMRAMILLEINCGFGNSDCASLPADSIDFARGWLRHPRPKTGIVRRCPSGLRLKMPCVRRCTRTPLASPRKSTG